MNGRRHALAAALLGTFAGCSGRPQSAVHDVDGAVHTPLDAGADVGLVQVFVVTSHECPIANAYAPVLADLAAAWRGQPVALYVVHADPDLTAEAAKAHAHDYALPGTILLDPEHVLIDALGATKTPEAVVRRDGVIRYRGRIDDQWRALGSRAQEPESHDLRDAVTLALARTPVAMVTTPVIGCLLPEPRPTAHAATESPR